MSRSMESASSRSSSAASSKAISEGHSSDSGASDFSEVATAGRGTKPANDKDGFKLTSLALEAATAQCSMCDDAMSSLLCTQCGRLSFCVPCCISLHDNKFLSMHKLVSLDAMEEGKVVFLSELKDRMKPKKTQQPLQHVDPQFVSDSAPSVTTEVKKPTAVTAAEGENAAENITDIAALAADRNIIQARLSEIASCRGLLQQAADSLGKERFQCKDISQTATDAVRRKFDILRVVIAEKEAEYIASVERAAKQRLEDATRASFEASASLAECDAFLDQTKLQLERLSSNKALFAEARASILSATESKLHSVDDTIQRLQNERDRITSISLGVHISLDKAIDEVRALVVPLQPLPPHRASEAFAKPISSEKFLDSPGVKVVRQRSTENDQYQIASEGFNGGGPAFAMPYANHRKSYQQELETLKNTPLKDLKTGPQQAATASPISLSKLVPDGSDANAKPSVSAATIARIAQKYTAGGVTGPASRSAAVPKELEKLRQVVASTTASLQRKASYGAASTTSMASSSRAMSPIVASRAESPLGGHRNNNNNNNKSIASTVSDRRSSPMRSTQLTPYRHSISPSRPNPDATPGPGAYYKQADFTARSMLSTPPRRR